MSRTLNMYILDEMIEQYERLNSIPKYDNKNQPTYDDAMEAQLVAGLLTELKVLRERTSLYEIQINRLEHDLRIKITLKDTDSDTL